MVVALDGGGDDVQANVPYDENDVHVLEVKLKLEKVTPLWCYLFQF